MAEKRHSIWALSEKEAEQLQKAADIIEAVFQKTLLNNNNSMPFMELFSLTRIEIKQELTRRRAAVKGLQRVAGRVFNGKWYVLSASVTGEDGKARAGKATYTDAKGVEREIVTISIRYNGQPATWINPEEYPLFYEATTFEEQHEALGLGADIKRLERWQEIALATIQDVYKQEEHSSDYLRTVNTPVTAVFSNVGVTALANKEKISTFDGDEFKIVARNGVEISVNSSAYNERLFKSPNVDKLMQQFNNKALTTGYANRLISLPLDEIMELRGITQAQKAKKSVEDELNALFEIKLEYRNSKTGSFAKGRIADWVEFDAQNGRRGTARIRYSPEYFEHIKNARFIGLYHKKVMKISGKKPNSYNIARAFDINARNNIGRSNENRMRVSTLLELCTFPAYDELKDKGQAAQLIIRPFIKALEYIEEMEIFSFSFRYSQSNSKTADGFLTQDDILRSERDYHFFSSLVVQIDWIDEADYTHLREQKQKVKALNEAKAKQRKKPVKK